MELPFGGKRLHLLLKCFTFCWDRVTLSTTCLLRKLQRKAKLMSYNMQGEEQAFWVMSAPKQQGHANAERKRKKNRDGVNAWQTQHALSAVITCVSTQFGQTGVMKRYIPHGSSLAIAFFSFSINMQIGMMGILTWISILKQCFISSTDILRDAEGPGLKIKIHMWGEKQDCVLMDKQHSFTSLLLWLSSHKGFWRGKNVPLTRKEKKQRLPSADISVKNRPLGEFVRRSRWRPTSIHNW